MTSCSSMQTKTVEMLQKTGELLQKTLQNLPEYKKQLEDRSETSPKLYQRNKRQLDKFFSMHPGPVDIAMILNEALDHGFWLADHLEKTNLLLFRPSFNYNSENRPQLLLGTPSSASTLLFFDYDMCSGNSLREAADFFEALHYQRKRMYAYLINGLRVGPNLPTLGGIEKLLAEAKKNPCGFL